MMKIHSFSMAMITVSVIMAIQSNSWVSIWMLMEVNMVGMMLQLMSESKKEKTILFLMFQSLPAASMATYLIMTKTSTDLSLNPQIKLLILMSMVCKIGLFPLHNWIMKMSKSISWFNNLILMTWQKTLPLVVLMKMTWSAIISVTTTLSMVAMSLILLNVMNLKSFIMASSLIHMGWMMASMAAYYWVSLSYMGIYTLLTLMVVMDLKSASKKLINNQGNEAINNMKINMLSLAGVPPLAGFLMKVVVLVTLVKKMESKKIVMSLLMVATLSFYAYMQIIYKPMLLMNSGEKSKMKNKLNHQKKFLSVNTGTPTAYYTY